MNFKTWLEATAGEVLTIPLNRLYGWSPKVEEVYEDIKAGRLSHSPNVPGRVSRLDNPRGGFFILDGYHRIVEAGIKGAKAIRAIIDEHVPRIERTGNAHHDMVAAKVPILNVVARLKTPVTESREYNLLVAQDSFLHFTKKSRAAEILKSGVLSMNPPYPKFGTDSVDAISVTYGQWVPGVQLTHIKATKEDPVVAIWFKTNVVPYAGYPEEVKWNKDVPLINPKILSADRAKSMLKSTGEDYEIIYG